MSSLHSLTTHPLFSILTTCSLLVLLYLPRCLLPFLLSPVPISTLLLLFTLLHFGSNQQAQQQQHPPQQPNSELIGSHPPEPPHSNDADIHDGQLGSVVLPHKPFYDDHFFGWCHRAPLEVIYEDYEGEEAEEDEEGYGYVGNGELGHVGLCCTDSESRSSSSPEIRGLDSPESLCFRWEGEEEEEMIEIELEEENLIEIDLSTYR